MSERLLIVGASSRPWIHSALVAGFSVSVFDFYADWDSRTSCSKAQQSIVADPRRTPNSIQRIESFESLFDGQFDAAFCDAAIVFGGFESRPKLVEDLAKQIPILGPGSDSLRRIRNAPDVFQFLRENRLPNPETKLRLKDKDDPVGWLRKRMGTSGGLGVRAAGLDDPDSCSADCYFQSKVDGPSVSAVFVSGSEGRGSQNTFLVGVTEQLVGIDWCGASDFQYCGSIGPIEVPTEWSDSIELLGRTLANEYVLQGLWGVDFIVGEAGLVPVDINPRLTASMELFESAVRLSGSSVGSMIDLHVQACRSRLNEIDLKELRAPPAAQDVAVEGKVVLYLKNPTPIQISSSAFDKFRRLHDHTFFESNEPGFSIADVPDEGQVIEPGHPILTLRVRSSRELVLPILRQRAAVVYGLLQECKTKKS